MPAANYDQAVSIAKAAIERIKHLTAKFRESEANPYASVEKRGDARRAASAATMEFAYQWENVDLILREKGL